MDVGNDGGQKEDLAYLGTVGLYVNICGTARA